MAQQISDQQQKMLKEYYKKLHEELEKICEIKQTGTQKNRLKSYLVTLLKGNQHVRQIPKDLKGKTARELKFLAIDRSLTESMYQFSKEETNVMNEYANKINQERDRQTHFGDALRDLVRLARMNNIARQHSSGLQS